MLFRSFVYAFVLLQSFIGCSPKNIGSLSQEKTIAGPHIVFIAGDEEYRSEESLPMLGRILSKELGARITVCYSQGEDGYSDPNRSDNIPGLEALETADLMVMFTRFRSLPEEQMRYITQYADSGKPMVGFRTSTHAFLYTGDLGKRFGHMNNEWPTRVFGQQWITHHGHFDDGKNPLTRVELMTGVQHPILNGVKPFDAYSWLYHVQGNGWNVYGDKTFILNGITLKSGHEKDGKYAYPPEQPVAWTKTYRGGRVFFTTLGHPYDFLDENMRKLTLNGIYWALGQEAMIPKTGVNAEIIDEYQPNNSGFGEKYKRGLKPR